MTTGLINFIVGGTLGLLVAVFIWLWKRAVRAERARYQPPKDHGEH